MRPALRTPIHRSLALSLLVSALTACAPSVPDLPPTFEPIADQRTPIGDRITVPFVIVDETPETVVVTASSGAVDLVADAGLRVIGSGADRTLHVTPAPYGEGVVGLTLMARDDAGQEGMADFALHVTPPFDLAPIPLTLDEPPTAGLFGTSVDLDGERAVVGAPGANEGRGAAYLFEHQEGDWMHIATLTADDGRAHDAFGQAVAIQGDHVVVGAFRHDVAGVDEGAAYVFRRRDRAWMQIAKLTAIGSGDHDLFGISVGIDADVVVVGANMANEGDGAAYVFEDDGETWLQTAELTVTDGDRGATLGTSVAIDAGIVIVGAELADLDAFDEGAAYLFGERQGVWTEIGKLTASDADDGDGFGQAVALRDGVAMVGAWGAGTGGSAAGAAYLFAPDADEWREIARLAPSDATGLDTFGWSVAIDGAYAIVGAPSHDASTEMAGAAYVFKDHGDGWSQVAKLVSSDPCEHAFFGWDVALSTSDAIVGANGVDVVGTSDGAADAFRK